MSKISFKFPRGQWVNTFSHSEYRTYVRSSTETIFILSPTYITYMGFLTVTLFFFHYCHTLSAEHQQVPNHLHSQTSPFHSVLYPISLKTKDLSCLNDNLQCHQSQQSCQIDNLLFWVISFLKVLGFLLCPVSGWQIQVWMNDRHFDGNMFK